MFNHSKQNIAGLSVTYTAPDWHGTPTGSQRGQLPSAALGQVEGLRAVSASKFAQSRTLEDIQQVAEGVKSQDRDLVVHAVVKMADHARLIMFATLSYLVLAVSATPYMPMARNQVLRFYEAR